MTSVGLLPGELWASVPCTPAHLHLYAVVTSSGFSVLTLQCRRLSRDNKIQKWREGVSSKPGQHGALRTDNSCLLPPSKIEVTRIGGVLAGVTLDFTVGARKRDSPAGTLTPLPRQSLMPEDCFTSSGEKCLLGGDSFWVSVSESPVWTVTMTLTHERSVNAKQVSPEWQNPHTSPEGSLTT